MNRGENMTPEMAEMVARAAFDKDFREELRNNPDKLVGLSFDDKKALLLALDSMDDHPSSDIEMEVETRVTKSAGGEGPWENTPFTG
jgi:hypothetical protein